MNLLVCVCVFVNMNHIFLMSQSIKSVKSINMRNSTYEANLITFDDNIFGICSVHRSVKVKLSSDLIKCVFY